MAFSKQNERMWTVREVADFLQVTERTVREWIKIKRLPAAKFGSQWRVHPKEIDRIIIGNR